MMRTLLVASLVAATAVGTAQATHSAHQQGGLSAAQIAAIDHIGQFSVSGHFTPSIVIAVERNRRTVYWRAFGHRQVESRVSAVPSTRYTIGSNTKQFVAAAILMLQEQGKLHVDDRVSKYFPTIPHADEVTLRQLLTMSSGYADYPEVPNFLSVGSRPSRSPADAVALVRDLPLDFPPATRWSYCNTGYMILQMLIEHLSGMPLHDFLQRRFFTPLGMRSTYLRLSHDTTPNVADEYVSFALGPWERAPHLDYTWLGGAGAVVSDVPDLQKWNSALDGGRLLSRRSLAEMLAPGPAASTPGGAGYGMGIRSGRMPNGHRFIWHGGDTIGSASQDARFPDDNLSIIVLTNGGLYAKDAAVEAIYKVVVPNVASVNPANQTVPRMQGDPSKIRAAISWLDDALAGRIDTRNLGEEMRASLTPAHQASLRALSQYGARTYTLAFTDRRRPTTTYGFLVETKKKKFVYVYKWDDAGQTTDISVFPLMEFPKEAIATPSPQPIPVQP